MATLYRNLSDEDLMRQISLKEDREAFSILYQRYAHLSLGMCLKYLNPGEAKDATQSIFLNLWESAQQSHILKFKPWFFKLVKSYCLKLIHKKETFHSEDIIEENEMEIDESLHLKLNEEQLLIYLNLCLKSLNLEQQNSLVQFYINQKSFEEIAHLSGSPFHQVKTQIQEGRRNLKMCLQQKMINH